MKYILYGWVGIGCIFYTIWHFEIPDKYVIRDLKEQVERIIYK